MKKKKGLTLKERINIEKYNEDGLYVSTEGKHLRRGWCCDNTCRHCPYIPEYSFKVKKEVLEELLQCIKAQPILITLYPSTVRYALSKLDPTLEETNIYYRQFLPLCPESPL